MEVHQLRYACAVADTGSFSRAAERCQIAQPSLSQQILKLEEDLGARLFDRLGRSIRLTEAGRAFLPHARSILDELDAARASVTVQHADVRGSVSVGVIPTVAPYLMPTYAAGFTDKFPEAKLRIVEDTTSVLVEALRDLSLDLAILALPLRHKDLEVFPLRTELVFAALPKNHPRAGSESLSLKDLRGEPFVMLRDGHCFRDLSIAACSSARITPNIAFETGQFSSVLAMVGAGVGISMVPEMAVDQGADCSYVRLTDARARRTIVLATLRGRSFNRVQKAFVEWVTFGVRGTAAAASSGT
ncbi:LysR family transcriptional regulator [Acidipila sp. EB88]|uniref:LysR family transcriptional regulator n=1 Tax=Acidipila sp. EB88 TaxID=2305226 RepID=UPI000F600C28|nr:LysR family transcriptional regulator [Acidipila sp. EB88]RRA49839.1 LysR family transcriptional regulator [Acidipila sp. EB88]